MPQMTEGPTPPFRYQARFLAMPGVLATNFFSRATALLHRGRGEAPSFSATSLRTSHTGAAEAGDCGGRCGRSSYESSGECDGSGVGLTMSALGVGLGGGAWNVSADTADMEGLILGNALWPGLGGV